MRIVAISGSLRSASSNGALLRAAASVAPPDVEVIVFDDVGQLPHFNPDLDGDAPPPAVAAFRRLLGAADAIIISTPEYAHGVPGAFKNALDWIVSSGELMRKPVALINASPSGGEYAQAALGHTLAVMEARVLPEASLLAPFARGRIDAEGRVTDPDMLTSLRSSLDTLAAAVLAERGMEAS